MALIFVVGTGRCGTSTIARLCHNHGIACMGHSFEGPNAGNPGGYFEDKTVLPLMLIWIRKGMSSAMFERELARMHNHTGTLGLKHPLLSAVRKKQWEELNPKHIFWADRAKEQTIYSMEHWKDWKGEPKRGRKHALATYERRYQMLLDGLGHWVGTKVTKIDFSVPRTDGWVLGRIMAGLKGGSK